MEAIPLIVIGVAIIIGISLIVLTSVDSATSQKKIEVTDELSKELINKAEFYGKTRVIRQEIQTLKIDIEGELKALKIDIEGKLKAYFLTLLFVVILVSPKAIDLIEKFLGGSNDMEAVLVILIGTAVVITGSLLFLRHYEKTHPKTKKQRK